MIESCGKSRVKDSHGSEASGWQYVKCIDDLLHRKALAVIRDAQMYCIISDTTSGTDCEWLTVVARVITPKRELKVSLLSFLNACYIMR